MTDARTSDINAFLTGDLATGFGKLRMSLFWLDNDAGAQDDTLRAAHIRRLGAELARLEDRAAALGQGLRQHEAAEVSQVTAPPLDAAARETGGMIDTPEETDVQIDTPEETDVQQVSTSAVAEKADPALEADLSDAVVDAAEDVGEVPDPTEPDAEADPVEEHEPMDAAASGIPDAQDLDADAVASADPDTDPAPPALVPEEVEAPLKISEAPSTPPDSRPRAGLPPAGLMDLAEGDEDALALDLYDTQGDDAGDDDTVGVGTEYEAAFAAQPPDESVESDHPDDSGEAAGAAVIELRPAENPIDAPPVSGGGDAGDPGADAEDLGVSIDALLDAAVAARSRSDNGELKLDLETLERLLGEVRATMP